METSCDAIGAMRTKLKQASLLWFEGFREACCLHRVLIYCFRSRDLMIRTGQCFLLNGLIFLGSIFLLSYVIIPTLQWILPSQSQEDRYIRPWVFGSILQLHSFLYLMLLQLFYILWFYPLYIFSFILSNIWYNDIAKYGFVAIENYGPAVTEPSSEKEILPPQSTTQMDTPVNFGGVMIGIAEQVYSVLLLSFFFLEVYITGFIPYVGKALNFVLLSWMYAYYCFEYKWNFTGLSLDKRLNFFESNWAFFAGFGSPCVLAIFFFSPLVSYALMAMLFPMFVLTAAGSDADKVIASQRSRWNGGGFGRLSIFYAADYLSMRVLSFFPLESREEKREKKAL